jgi:hypothetical protein
MNIETRTALTNSYVDAITSDLSVESLLELAGKYITDQLWQLTEKELLDEIKIKHPNILEV